MRIMIAGTKHESEIVLDEKFDPLAGLRMADEYLEKALRGEEYLLFDGAMGTMLQKEGLARAGALPDMLNLEQPEAITGILAQYVAAGSQIVTTNTFGANRTKLEGLATVAEVYAAAVACARASGARYVAADVGPLGALLEPLGPLTFEEAYELFAEQMRAARAAGADLILIETMTDLREIKAAVLAAKAYANLPIVASMTYGEDGRTFLGTSPEVASISLCALGVHAVGVNCSLGPDELLSVVEAIARRAPCPVFVKPNAGLPRVEDGETVFDVSPEDFGRAMRPVIEAGASFLGGCCGTDPAYIEQISKLVADAKPPVRNGGKAFAVTSAQKAVILEEGSPVIAIIGERINPTGKPRLREALKQHDYDYLVGEALKQQDAGADILDVNVGLPDIDEAEVLVNAVQHLQTAMPLPLQVDSTDPVALEAAVRIYAGKPLINSVNGKQESLDSILPIAKGYGCAVLGLTLDEEGIPSTAEGRFAIAERIVQAAGRHGIPAHDVVIDCLVMAAATNQSEVLEIAKATRLVKERLGVRTALGVSNVSFGLPEREVVNASFLAVALGAGLDLPILNPGAWRSMDIIRSYRVLNGQDEGAQDYISGYAPGGAYAGAGSLARSPKGSGKMSAAPRKTAAPASGTAGQGAPANVSASAKESGKSTEENGETSLEESAKHLIMTGRKERMGEVTQALLEHLSPVEIIDAVFIPALDEVGDRYESGEYFLPQMMAAAEAAKAGFDTLRAERPAENLESDKKICLATVKGDIHDIGKNIVAMLLENYGYQVFDLGRDVDPRTVVDTVKENGIKLVGLSALMTTTVRAMEETIALLHAEVPGCRVFVGGAVLTEDFALKMGADYYGKDAAEAARIASLVFSS